MTLLHLIVFALELVLAGLFAHKAVPSVIAEGKLKAIKMLLLAISLAFASIGQLMIVIYSSPYRSFLIIGHLAIIAYAGLSYWQLRRDGIRSWFHEGKDLNGLANK